MNIEPNRHRLGVSLGCAGMGIYLLVLESVRLINIFAAEFYALTSVIYLLGCFVCSLLITAGVILFTGMDRQLGIVATLISGIVGFSVLGIALLYCAYLVPYSQHNRFEVSDWLLVSTICLAGVLLVMWGWFNGHER